MLRTAASEDLAAVDVVVEGMMVTYLVEDGNHHTSASDRARYQELGMHAVIRLFLRPLAQRRDA